MNLLCAVTRGGGRLGNVIEMGLTFAEVKAVSRNASLFYGLQKKKKKKISTSFKVDEFWISS